MYIIDWDGVTHPVLKLVSKVLHPPACECLPIPVINLCKELLHGSQNLSDLFHMIQPRPNVQAWVPFTCGR